MKQKSINKVNDSPNEGNHELNPPPFTSMNHSGECFCGDIRFRISGEPVFQLYCFCKNCHLITGTDGYYSGFLVKEADFHLIGGTPATHEVLSKDGRTINRHYCRKCGSNLWAQTDLGLLSVSPSTFNDPDVFLHTKKVYVDEAPDWARAPNDSAQQQDLSSKEIDDDEDDAEFDFAFADLVFGPVTQHQDGCTDEDETDLQFENVEPVLELVPQYQDSGANEDDTDLEFENLDQVPEVVSQNQDSRASEDDTNLEIESVGNDDRHSLVNFSCRHTHSSSGQKP